MLYYEFSQAWGQVGRAIRVAYIIIMYWNDKTNGGGGDGRPI